MTGFYPRASARPSPATLYGQIDQLICDLAHTANGMHGCTLLYERYGLEPRAALRFGNVLHVRSGGRCTVCALVTFGAIVLLAEVPEVPEEVRAIATLVFAERGALPPQDHRDRAGGVPPCAEVALEDRL